MNFFELGKEVQTLLAAASAIDKRLSDNAAQAVIEETTGVGILTTSDIPCSELQRDSRRRIVFQPVSSDFRFQTSLRAFTIISNISRENDYVVATVSRQELVDENGNGVGNNAYLMRTPLQSMVELADNLTALLGEQVGVVDLCYGIYNYRTRPNPPGNIPVIFGVRASWTPTAGDFNNPGVGLLVSLEAKLDGDSRSCRIGVKAMTQESFNGPITEFRMGQVATVEKLSALAVAYVKARVRKIGLQELEVNDGVLRRMQLE